MHAKRGEAHFPQQLELVCLIPRASPYFDDDDDEGLAAGGSQVDNNERDFCAPLQSMLPFARIYFLRSEKVIAL